MRCFYPLIDFGSTLAFVLAPFSIILVSLFRASFSHQFFFYFGMDFDIIFDVFLMIFLVRTLTLPNLVFWRQYSVLAWFYTSGKHVFALISSSFSLPVFALIFDAFLHRFRYHFGTLLASGSVVLGDRFFHDFPDGIFPVFCSKMLSKRVQNGDRNAARKVQESGPKPCRRTYSLLGSILARFWTDLGGFWNDFGSILQGFLKDLGVVFLSLLSCVSRAKLPKVTLTKHV